MAVIQFENGQKVNFEGNPSQANIAALAQKMGIGAAAPPAPGYSSRLGADYSQAASDIAHSVQTGADALQHPGSGLLDEFSKAGSLLQTGLRTAGNVAGAAFSPITEAPVIKQGIQGVGALISKIPGVQHVIDNAAALAARHPELAKDIESIVNVATLGSAAPAAEKGVVQSALEKTGQALQDGAGAATQKTKDDFLRQLLTPEQTKAVREDQVGRTSETGSGIFKRSVVEPTPSQLHAEQAVAKIPGVDPSATVQQNYNVIKSANQQEALNLKSQIAANDFAIPKKETLSRLATAAKELESSPVIVGDAEKTAQKLIAGAREFINNNPGTGSGLLEARKQFDQWVLHQKPAAFDAKAENAFTIANRQVRHTFNDLLDEKATNVDVKNSLAHQSALYNALDTLTPKAATEADTAIGRAMQRVGKVLGTKNKVVQAVAAAAGIGGLGAAATFAPVVAGVGIPAFLTYKAGQYLLKPGVRSALGTVLEKAGPALDKSDRAAIEGILQNYEDHSAE